MKSGGVVTTQDIDFETIKTEQVSEDEFVSVGWMLVPDCDLNGLRKAVNDAHQEAILRINDVGLFVWTQVRAKTSDNASVAQRIERASPKGDAQV